MSFLAIENKTFLVFGVANKKSVAYHVARVLEEAGAIVIHSVQTPEIKENVSRLFPGAEIYTCNVGSEEDISALARKIREKHSELHGIVHSIAFANYGGGVRPFHEMRKQDFLQSIDISCYSLVSIANHFRELLHKDASVVTISISTTRMAAENYGMMGPVKAALNSVICFLARSFSSFSRVRFNAVGASLLKTSASAGIPGYLDFYLYAEQLTLRKRALSTQEVANTVVYLLSPRSSGINAQVIIHDCGMSVNYFDPEIVKKVVRG